jgi:hypothetical protein
MSTRGMQLCIEMEAYGVVDMSMWRWDLHAQLLVLSCHSEAGGENLRRDDASHVTRIPDVYPGYVSGGVVSAKRRFVCVLADGDKSMFEP